MNGAFDAGGQVVGVLADSLERAVARPGTRRGVADGQIRLVTPYTPGAPFSVGNAMGRNKIIYGLSRCTIVIASDLENGGTWAGSTEALKNHYGRVASWTGPGSGPGNRALIERGADELSDIGRTRVRLECADATPSAVAGFRISGTSQRNEPFRCGVLVHGSRRTRRDGPSLRHIR